MREKSLEENIELGLYDKEQIRAHRAVLKTLDGYLLEVKKQNLMDREEAFEYIRDCFGEQTAKREEQMETSGQYLENAFDFMEFAFLESQEMVVFVTELTVNRYSAAFIQENGCDRFYQYNKRLLFGQQQREILSGINEVKELWKNQIQ